MREFMHMRELSNADWPANPVGIKLGMSMKLLDVADIGTVPGINVAQEFHTADGSQRPGGSRCLPSRINSRLAVCSATELRIRLSCWPMLHQSTSLDVDRTPAGHKRHHTNTKASTPTECPVADIVDKKGKDSVLA